MAHPRCSGDWREPNPIGVTTVAIDRLAGDSVYVRGLDAIGGTPVLDVKPHVATGGRNGTRRGTDH